METYHSAVIGSYRRRRRDVLIARRGYVLLRRLGDVALRRHWVLHLRRTCDVSRTYREMLLRRPVARWSQFFRNMHLLCDAIVLNQLVEGTLTTALNELHFIVNLYSFALQLVPQAKLSFPKASHYSILRQKNFQKFPLQFLLTHFFEVISTPRLESIKL